MKKYTINKTEKFTIVSNELLTNKDLNDTDLRILLLLLSLPENFQVNAKNISNMIGKSEDTVKKSLNRLIDMKYLKREKVKNKNKFGGYEYTVYENTSDYDYTEKKQKIRFHNFKGREKSEAVPDASYFN